MKLESFGNSLSVLAAENGLDIAFSHCKACTHSYCNSVCNYPDMPAPDIDQLGQCQSFIQSVLPEKQFNRRSYYV